MSQWLWPRARVARRAARAAGFALLAGLTIVTAARAQGAPAPAGPTAAACTPERLGAQPGDVSPALPGLAAGPDAAGADPGFDAPILGDAGRRVLQAAIVRYRGIAARGGWDPVPGGAALKQGSVDPVRVPLLRRRLAATGDGDGDATGRASAVFDPGLTAAVEHFQARHGLDVDGVVGPRTRDALNVPVELRIAQLGCNLARIAAFPRSPGGRHVFINIPGQQLEAVEDGRVVQRHRVVIGKVDRQTPPYISEITSLAFNPTWHVPRSIAGKDILPQIRADPDYLSRLGIRVFDAGTGRELDPAAVDWDLAGSGDVILRQQPGPDNALGTVKILFPNPHAVYLHDTPAQSVFERAVRTASSGCIRVENVHDLTAWLLMPQGWDRARVDALVASGAREAVVLRPPVPIYIVYLTAWVDDEGRVNFRDDIYGRDIPQMAL